MQTAALEKIQREHLRVGTEQIRANLRRIGYQVQGQTIRECVQQWDELVRGNDVDSIRRVVLGGDEVAAEMRNLSPLTIVLTEQESLQVLEQLRQRVS
ncbi:hypothetical protein ACWPOB_16715 [Rhodococcus sp. 2H158]